MERTLNKVSYTREEQDIAMFAKALSHPVRVAILNYLDRRCSCFTGDLVEIFPMAQSTISQHLNELKKAGLIQGEVNPPKTKYCINQKNWEMAKKLFNEFFEIDFSNISCSV